LKQEYPSGVPLKLAEAQALVAAAHQHAREKGWRITVAVVDEGGVLQALGRMDGAPPLSSQIAEAKAVGCAVWLREGESLQQVQAERPAFFDSVNRLTRLPIMPGLGSALIRREGVVLGAVGVSGAASDQDLECARAGMDKIGLGTP
jgi:glc operon protein GlcG